MATVASRKQYIYGLCLILLAAIGLYGLLPHLSSFSSSRDALGHASVGLVIAALVSSLLSSMCSVAMYQTLSFKRLHWLDTGLVQLSGLFVNRVLPAGIGGLGLNFLYLRHRKHSTSQATAVVALNNLLGFVGHAVLTLLIVGGLALTGQQLAVKWPHISSTVLWLLAIGLLIGVIGLLVWRGRSASSNLGLQISGLARHYTRRPGRIALAIVISMFLTLSNVISLWLCCQALSVGVSFVAVFLIFTLGIAAGTATPTPGGLGGIEAALVAGLVTQQVPTSLALAAALLYRLISFWIGLIIGAISLVAVQSRRLLVNT